MLLVFQPLVAIGLAMLLPTLELARPRARRLGAFGVGMLVVTAGLLIPLLLGGDADTGGGTDRRSEQVPGREGSIGPEAGRTTPAGVAVTALR